MIDAASLKAVCWFVKTISNKQMESKIFDKIDLLEKKVDTILIRDLLAAFYSKFLRKQSYVALLESKLLYPSV